MAVTRGLLGYLRCIPSSQLRPQAALMLHKAGCKGVPLKGRLRQWQQLNHFWKCTQVWEMLSSPKGFRGVYDWHVTAIVQPDPELRSSLCSNLCTLQDNLLKQPNKTDVCLLLCHIHTSNMFSLLTGRNKPNLLWFWSVAFRKVSGRQLQYLFICSSNHWHWLIT